MHLVRILIITSLTFFLSTQSSYSSSSKVDSLLQKIEQTNGEPKLELILELIKVNHMPEELNNSIEMLRHESEKQGNMRYLAASYTSKAKYFINIYEMDSALYNVEQANQMYKKYNIKNPNQTYYYLSFIYLSKGYYDLAIHNLKIYLKDKHNEPMAYQLLGQLYFLSGRLELAKESYLKAITLINQVADTPSSYDKITLYQGLGVIYHYDKKYALALEACSIAADLSNEKLGDFPESTKNVLLCTVNNLYANIYIGMDDDKTAKVYLDKIDQIPQNNLGKLINIEKNGTLSEYYILLKDYNKALYYLDESLPQIKKENVESQYLVVFMNLKIDVLEKLGRYNDAFFSLKEVTHYKDSINNENVPLQISQLLNYYELEKINLEQQKDKAQLERSQTMIGGLIAAIFLLCIILFLVRRNSRNVKAKNEILFKQYEKVDKYVNLTGKRLTSEKRDETVIEDRELSLFNKIEEYMLEHEPYKKTDLSREDIAEALNTNWLYVINAIRAEAGKTFFDYVNEHRLNYARLQFMKDKSMPVGNIISNSGFSSNATFYRLFKQKFGMSPNELRQIKVRLEHDMLKDDEN